MSELPLNSCESCGGVVKRIITGGTGLIFKGSGLSGRDGNLVNFLSTHISSSDISAV